MRSKLWLHITKTGDFSPPNKKEKLESWKRQEGCVCRGGVGGGPRAIRTTWDLEIESKQRLK